MTTRQWLMLGGLLYVMTIAIVIFALTDARRRMVATYASPEEQAYWNDFNDDMRQREVEKESLRGELAGYSDQPVEFAPPKKRSDRPPTLELLENHFAACLAVCLAGVTMLFALLWGMFMGAMLRPGRVREDSAESDTAAAKAN